MQILRSLQLTDNQKRVLSTIMSAKTPEQAEAAITGDQNLQTAAKVLKSLGLLDVTDNASSVTEKGIKVMTDSGLADDSGQLTSDGQGFAIKGDSDPSSGTPPDDGMGGLDMGGAMGTMGGAMPGGMGGLDGLDGEIGPEGEGMGDENGDASLGQDPNSVDDTQTMTADKQQDSAQPDEQQPGTSGKVTGSFESHKPQYKLLKQMLCL